MSKEFEAVSGECYKSLKANFLGEGYDSKVFRNGDEVKRVYTGSYPKAFVPTSTEKLFLYWQVTDKASQQDFEIEFPFSKERYLFRVNPFIRMYRCVDCGYIEADSKYISGMGIVDLPKRFDIKELSVVLKNVDQALDKRLNVNGINLDHGNIKSPEEGLIIITDLCTSINNLRKRLW